MTSLELGSLCKDGISNYGPQETIGGFRGGRGYRVKGIEEGTRWDEHGVLHLTTDPLKTTSRTVTHHMGGLTEHEKKTLVSK